MLQKIQDDLIWCKQHHVLISLNADWHLHSHTDLSQVAYLILVAHKNIPYRLVTAKNRALTLTYHEPMLCEMLTEFEIIDDGWRGAVQLSESEWVRLKLTWG